MKKKSLLFTCILLTVSMLLVFCGCSSYGGIKSAYEKEGYKEYEITDVIKEAFNLKDEDIQDSKAAIHFLSTAEIGKDDNVLVLLAKVATSKSAIVWEYKDVDALQEVYKEKLSKEEQENFDKLWAEYQKLPTVNGNCILVWGDQEVFQKAK